MYKKNLFQLAIMLTILLNKNLSSQSQLIENIYFEPSKNQIVIYYDLLGNKEDEYEIQVFLKSEIDPLFKIRLIHANGDIGKGYFVGSKRKILWDITRDFSAALEGEEWYFEIVAEKVKGIPWYYYAGAVAIGGATAILLLNKKSEDNSDKTAIGAPPIRP